MLTNFCVKTSVAEDLRNMDACKEKLYRHLEFANAQLAFYGKQEFFLEEILNICLYWQEKLAPLLCNSFDIVHSALKKKANIIFEGQLGAMKDIDLGIFPFVTSILV